MADKTASNLKLIAIVIGLLLAIVSPIVTVAIANEQGKASRQATVLQIKASQDAARAAQIAAIEQMKSSSMAASQKADKALDLAEKNARDFEYFKGEMTATMKAVNKSIDTMGKSHKDGLDKMDVKIDKLEGKIDEIIKIMGRFKRVDDGK